LNDTQILLTMAGMAIAIVIPFVGWLLRIDRRSARLIREAEDAREIHEAMDRKIAGLREDNVKTRERISAVEGELKRVNGKH